MILVVVTTFKAPQNLEEVCKSNGIEYFSIDIEKDDDPIEKTVPYYLSVPAKIVENLFTKTNKLIYVRNDGTFNDEEFAVFIKEYVDNVKSLLENSEIEDLIKIEDIRLVTIKNKIKLLKFVEIIRNNNLQNIGIDEEQKNLEKVSKNNNKNNKVINKIKEEIEEIEEDIESLSDSDEDDEDIEESSELDDVIGKYTKGDLLEAEIEEIESDDENIKLFTIQLVNKKGVKQSGKVRLDIDSDDGVFTNGRTSTIINVDKDKENIFKVIVTDNKADVEFSYDIIED